MQPLSSRPARLFGAARSASTKDAAGQRRSDVRWGLAGLAAIVVFAAVVALVSAVRVGVSTYTAEMSDAGAVRVGDDVRVAGLPVGAVRSLTALSDHVEMTFTVRSGAFVGDQSSLAIRMLSIVGGHYVALTPAGTTPLGSTPIPSDRVVLPYSLPQVFQDAVAPVQAIDGRVLRQNFAALETSIDNSPSSFGSFITAVGTVVDILTKQNADISRSLSLADEYLTSLNASKAVVVRLVESLRLLDTIVEDNKLAVGASLRHLAEAVARLAPVGEAWDSTLEPMARPLADSIPKLADIAAELGALLDSVRLLEQRIPPLLAPGAAGDRSGAAVPPPMLCVPVPGRVC